MPTRPWKKIPTAARISTPWPMSMRARDWENAVKYQARSRGLEPHSGLIVGKFKVFQAKRKEQQTAGER